MTQRNSKVTLLLLLGALSCGYISSGTWEDDPKNWKRAFRSTKPPDVVVVHSKYYRSPHWSYEFQYFFHIRANTSLEQQLVRDNHLRKLSGDELATVKDYFGDSPAWFAPKPADQYDIWKFTDERNRNFRVFIDRKTRDLFLTDYLV